MNMSPEELQRLYVAMKNDYEVFARTVMGHIVTEVPDYQHQVYQALNKRYENNAFVLFRGAAKRLSLDTQVLTPNGWVNNGDLKVGDKVIGSNGRPCNVVNVSDSIVRPLYRVTTRDGRSALADSEHLWKVKRISGGAGFYKDKEIVMTTQELIDFPVKSLRFDKRYNKYNEECFYAIETPKPIEMSKLDYDIHPYTIGVILGDGSISNSGYVRIHSSISDIEETYNNVVWENKSKIRFKKNSNACYFSLLGCSKYMRNLNLLCNVYSKHIPKQYLCGSIEQRLDLLRGLLDTDGTCSKNKRGCSFVTVSERLKDDVVYLVRSLGGTATVSSSTNKLSSCDFYRISICFSDGTIPFKIKRKADFYAPYRRSCNAITSIVYEKDDIGRCIEVDSEDSLFVINDFLLTHNSSISKSIQVTSDLCFAREAFTILLSESIDQASKDLVSVVDEIENNEIIRALFGNLKGSTWNKEEIEASNGCFVQAKGYGSRIRGLKWKNMRITKNILDDYESENNTATEKQRDGVFDWIEAQVLRAGIPLYTTNQFFGTVVHPEAHLAKIKNLPEFQPPRGFYLEVPVSKNGVSAWESRFPMKYILEKEEDARAKNKLSLWLQEMYHIPAVIGKPRFNISMISKMEATFHNEVGITYLQTAMGTKIPVNVFIGVDPAISVSEKADSSIFFVIGVTPDSEYVVLHVEKAKVKPFDQARIISKLVERFDPVYVTIETQGYQGALPDICREMMSQGSPAFTIREFKSNKSKNNKWLLGLDPYINQGKMMYMSNCAGIQEFFDECTAYNEEVRAHDDTIDGAFLAIHNSYSPSGFNVDEVIHSLKNKIKKKPKPLNYMVY